MDGFRHEEKFFISTASARMLQGACARLWDGMATRGRMDAISSAASISTIISRAASSTRSKAWKNGRNTASAFTIWTTATSASSSSRSSAPLTRKRSAPLTREQADAILAGDTLAAVGQRRPPCCGISISRPAPVCSAPPSSSIICGRRTCSGMSASHWTATCTRDSTAPTCSAPSPIPCLCCRGDRLVLEVKYDDALPYAVRQLLRPLSAARCAISKYELCRGLQ